MSKVTKCKKRHAYHIIILMKLVMLRAWVFRASGGLGLLCIGPRAGRAFLYRASGLFRAFSKHSIQLFFFKNLGKKLKKIFGLFFL